MISVIIPTYNCAVFLKDAIDSVLRQTYKDFEIIVIDDGSTDDTKQVINSYNENIKYFYQKNRGVSSARNKGILEARGQYIAFLDSDDIFCEEYLTGMLKKIDQGYDWVVCDNYREEIDISTGDVKREIISRDMQDCSRGHYLKQFLIRDKVGSPNKILVKRELLVSKNIFFDERLKSREDWDFCLQLLRNNFILGWIEKPLVVYRIRNDYSNSTRKLGYNWLDYTYILLKKYMKDYIQQDLRCTLSGHYYDLARKYFYKFNFTMSGICLFHSIRFNGFSNVLKTIKNKLF